MPELRSRFVVLLEDEAAGTTPMIIYDACRYRVDLVPETLREVHALPELVSSRSFRRYSLICVPRCDIVRLF